MRTPPGGTRCSHAGDTARAPAGSGKHGAALRAAVVRGDIAKVKALIADGADVNAQDDDVRNTPLHLAVAKGRLDLIDALLQGGAEPNLMNRDGFTPLTSAEFHGRKDIIKKLKAAAKP